MTKLEMKEFEGKNSSDPSSMLSEMEKVLVDASLAYDIGLQQLKEDNVSFMGDEVADRLEQVKELYFSARSFLNKHAPEKLEVLEQKLISKKQALQTVYHA